MPNDPGHGVSGPLISTLFGFARGRRWALPLLVLLGLLTALAEGIGIGMMIPLFSAMFDTGAEGDRFGTVFSGITDRLGMGLDQEGRVLLLTLVILALITAKSLVQYAYEGLSIWFSGHLVHRLRQALFDQLMAVGFAFFAGRDQGRLFDILRGETWLAGEFVILLSRAVISLCAIAVFGVLLLLISPVLTLAAATGGVAIALLVRLVARRCRRLGQETVETGAALSRRTIEALGNMRVIRLFGQEARERERFTAESEADRAASLRVELAGAMIHPATELLYAPLFLGILLAAWKAGVAFPTLIAFLVLLYRLQPHARRLDHIRVEMAALLPAVQQITRLLDRSDKPYPSPGHLPYPGLSGGIRFENVDFAYEGDPGGPARPAVSGIGFDIARNRVTALVGESGAGKSTIVNLLCRLYEPTGGAILVDGARLSDLDAGDWRRRIAFAGQDADLMGDTVRDAIAFGRPDAGMEAIEAAARKAHAADFIAALPDGYATRVGERGTQLSAGQRQRIGLARALLVEPEILILDEATSALDSLSESLVQEALRDLKGTVTTVVIAHRLSTIRDADHVVVLRGGRIVEQGRPGDLLADPDSAFTTLWRLQSGTFSQSPEAPVARAIRAR